MRETGASSGVFGRLLPGRLSLAFFGLPVLLALRTLGFGVVLSFLRGMATRRRS